MENSVNNIKDKKPIYKKVWFWIILSMVLLFFILFIWIDVAIYFGDLGKPYDETRIVCECPQIDANICGSNERLTFKEYVPHESCNKTCLKPVCER